MVMQFAVSGNASDRIYETVIAPGTKVGYVTVVIVRCRNLVLFGILMTEFGRDTKRSFVGKTWYTLV